MPDIANNKNFLQNIKNNPGIYQMFDANNVLLYVGKAGKLKNRISSYFNKSNLSIKNQSLIAQVADIQIIITNSETEALILENNLIKKYRPKYNILLRDDKTYPYIHLTEEKYPRLKFYRGKRSVKGKYFGPYYSASAVKETLDIMQKIFRIRNCDNIFFKNRSRPCLQYQIKRCTAPCVNLIDSQTYKQQITDAVSFLQGKNDDLLTTIENNMLVSAKNQLFENATLYRDQLQSLRKILEKQYITNSNQKNNADVIALISEQTIVVIQVFYYRNGSSLGTKSYFPKINGNYEIAEIMQSFIEQIYLNKMPPDEIICNHRPNNEKVLKSFFSSKYNKSVRFSYNPRKHRARWLKLAENNAKLALSNKKILTTSLQKKLTDLTCALGIKDKPDLMACVDISHTKGEETVGSYVVFDQNGPKKSDYRRYNIKGINNGDDYAAIEQLLTRRFTRLQQQDNLKIKNKTPDILFIDGGQGQLNKAKEVLIKLAIDDVLLVGIAKGADRKAGMEKLIIGNNNRLIKLAAYDPALHLIQQIRDEAHRFAIIGHRKKRDKKRLNSILKEIEGIGNKKRQCLLKYFAGIRGVKNASVEELQKVEGISFILASRIYDYFH